jgi:hypothetical protein
MSPEEENRMREKQNFGILLLLVVLLTMSCNLPGQVEGEDESVQETGDRISAPDEKESYSPGEPPSDSLIRPEDFSYLGFFRLPEPSGGSDWDYSGHGLTFYPDGDPEGSDDDFPGSLFGFGHDQQLFVSEITIPIPAVTDNLEEANTAQTLQPFSDLTGGIFSAPEMTIPRAGIEYLPEPEPHLHFTFGQHIQDFEPSHGWANLDLSNPEAQGAWVFDGYTNYVTNDYLFEIPPEWADAIAPGPLLASGRAREGLWSGRGPGLFAYSPGDPGNPLSPGDAISGVMPLLLYGEQFPDQPDVVSTTDQAVTDYREADHWWGGAWITSVDASGVVFAGTKALGEEWYGFSNGVVWEHDCADHDPPTCPNVPEWPYDNRGFWADDYQAQIIFYNPSDLVAVAAGEMESWEPQPYAVFVIDEYLLDPELNHEEYKRDLVGGVAFDRENCLFYLVERLADQYQSVIHVWSVGD